MSLLGIDVGTSGCKSIVFSLQGKVLAKASREYDMTGEGDRYSELDSLSVWGKVKETIKEASSLIKGDPIKALSVSSLGEALVPVTKDRIILGNSILGIDQRGDEFLEKFLERISPEEVFRINGNFPGVFYSMPKIAWIKKNKPDLYSKTDYFLTWADFVCFMLGGRPITNFSLANRTLLFDNDTCRWSEKLFQMADLDAVKFAPPNPSGINLGNVSREISRELNLTPDIKIISGGHDQC
jgi:xylulokinase